MPLHVSLLQGPLNLENPNPEICMDQETSRVCEYLNLLNFFLCSGREYLFMSYRFLHVYIQDCEVSFLICYEQFLILYIPEYGSIDTLIGILNGEKFSSISCIKAFQLLIERDSENEISLDYNYNLDYAYAMKRLVFLAHMKNSAISCSPIIRCLEF